MTSFNSVVREHCAALVRDDVRVLQLNLGRLCNLVCNHCHVSAGPKRVEIMSVETARRCLAWIDEHRPPVVDLTGGAPELCPSFVELAEGAVAAGARCIVRSNLTTLVEPGGEELVETFRRLGLHVVASLPCYLESNVDAQRGPGTYAASIAALKRLNDAGYGHGAGLVLDLVYNPAGSSLPPPQASLESDYRRELSTRHEIRFDHLLCITNMPIGRFGAQLRAHGEFDRYVERLVEAFNPATIDGLMCRDTLSVDWRGELFDCDFNQMLELPLAAARGKKLWEVDSRALAGAPIATDRHCFGCSAGSGSSCSGALLQGAPLAGQ